MITYLCFYCQGFSLYFFTIFRIFSIKWLFYRPFGVVFFFFVKKSPADLHRKKQKHSPAGKRAKERFFLIMNKLHLKTHGEVYCLWFKKAEPGGCCIKMQKAFSSSRRRMIILREGEKTAKKAKIFYATSFYSIQ